MFLFSQPKCVNFYFPENFLVELCQPADKSPESPHTEHTTQGIVVAGPTPSVGLRGQFADGSCSAKK